VIDELKKAHSIKQLCALLEHPRSSYYAWRRARQAPRNIDAMHLAMVKHIHRQTRRSYGTRRMAAELRRRGVAVGRHRARTLMRQAGIWGDRRRRGHAYRRAEQPAATAANHLDRHFEVARPNQVWVGDITFIPTRQGWLYLAIVVDLYARRIVGWAFSAQPTMELAWAALQRAIDTRRPDVGLMFHSDQGVQYTSVAFVQRLRRHGIVQSMSRRGNCWDNAVAERVFATLKREWIEGIYADRQHAEEDLSVFLCSFYNHHRLHAAAGQLPPAVFEAMAA
jgi:putative transposase